MCNRSSVVPPPGSNPLIESESMPAPVVKVIITGVTNVLAPRSATSAPRVMV